MSATDSYLIPGSQGDDSHAPLVNGRAIFDFDTGWTVGATFVSVIPGNSMKPDVTGLRKLVSNTRQRTRTVTYTKVGKNTFLHATDKTQLATSFVTGSNADGYTLDRITAYIERTITGSTVTGVPKVAIHSNGTGNLPGTPLCELQMLADYRNRAQPEQRRLARRTLRPGLCF